ncbi:MAG: toprim domain-containing protein [Candidatus Thermoplasmatota archaeon]|nr:toprim domain-containing protein [Candidatus Thermoplasmatota archaeon]
MDYKKSFDELEKVLFELIEENKKIPIVVEGDKDVFSLRKLGVTGEIITTNSGLSIIDFCDKIAKDYKEIILLTDWDKKGGFICHTIQRNLQGRVKCNLYYRELFAIKAMTKTVEGLYSWFNTIKEKIEFNNKNFIKG